MDHFPFLPPEEVPQTPTEAWLLIARVGRLLTATAEEQLSQARPAPAQDDDPTLAPVIELGLRREAR
jgi:hypothetical protein